MNRVREVSPVEHQECLFLKKNVEIMYLNIAYLSYSLFQMALIEARSKHSFKKKRGIHFIISNLKLGIILEYIGLLFRNRIQSLQQNGT